MFICFIFVVLLVFVDQECIPIWETFFRLLSQRINDQSSSHTSVLKEVIDKLSGPVQLPVEYPEQVALCESDLVEPVIVRGVTDISTTAERQKILELRAESANLLRLQGTLVSLLSSFLFSDRLHQVSEKGDGIPSNLFYINDEKTILTSLGRRTR